jgi:hypothetical protein
MRRLVVIFVVVAALGVAASPASSDRFPVPRCPDPHFRGVSYAYPYTFRTAWFRVGKPLGAVYVVDVCNATPNDPQEGRTVRVFRLKGLKPNVALSVGGSSRQLLIRSSSRCVRDELLIESQIVRCLRRMR